MTNVLAMETRRDPEQLPLLLSVPKAAAMLGVSRSATYRLVYSGDLPSKRLGGRIYVATADLLALAS